MPYINFANLLSSVNELERALAFYNRALELDNSAAAAYYGAGNVYVMKESFSEAKDMFEKRFAPEWKTEICFICWGPFSLN